MTVRCPVSVKRRSGSGFVDNRHTDGTAAFWVLRVIRTRFLCSMLPKSLCVVAKEQPKRCACLYDAIWDRTDRGLRDETAGKRNRVNRGTVFVCEYRGAVLDGQEDQGTRPESQGCQIEPGG